jgi:hypothetical protein
LGDHKKALDFALKSLEVLNTTQGIPDYSIAATYNRVFKAYIELEDYNAAFELALKHFEEVKNTPNVSDSKLAFTYNLIAVSYKWSAEATKNKESANKYFIEAIVNFKRSIDKLDGKDLNQILRAARITINIGLCENEVLLIAIDVKNVSAQQIVKTLEKGLKEIKNPNLESFISKSIKKLIEKGESTLANLTK